jgi:hypothetical protein
MKNPDILRLSRIQTPDIQYRGCVRFESQRLQLPSGVGVYKYTKRIICSRTKVVWWFIVGSRNDWPCKGALMRWQVGMGGSALDECTSNTGTVPTYLYLCICTCTKRAVSPALQNVHSSRPHHCEYKCCTSNILHKIQYSGAHSSICYDGKMRMQIHLKTLDRHN